MKLIRLIGLKYPTKNSTKRRSYGLYECPSCLDEFEMSVSNAKITKQCKSCSSTIHGLRKHKLYNIWAHQRRRCLNKSDRKYKDYGGRGIKFSEEFSDFPVWLNYVESLDNSNEKDYTLDRINNDGNYERGNLRWASKATQVRNTRRIKTTNTSGYRGVGFSKAANKWVAKIDVDKKRKHLGVFEYPWTGAYVYDSYILNNKLEHTMNFIPDGELR